MDENIEVETSNEEKVIYHCPIKNTDCIGENCAMHDDDWSCCYVLSCGDSLNQIIKLINNPRPKQYEYLAYSPKREKAFTLIDYSRTEELLNQLGVEGWELVNAVTTVANGTTDDFIYYLKREKKL